jgi:hypothetical protein
LTLDLDIGGAVGIVFQKSLQPYDLTNFLSSETFSLFTGSTFVTNGGVLNVTATEKTTISDANLFIIKFAHNYGQF